MKLDIDLGPIDRIRVLHPELDREPDVGQFARFLNETPKIGPTCTILLMRFAQTRQWRGESFAWMNAGALARDCGVGLRQLRDSLNRLDRYGYIAIRPAVMTDIHTVWLAVAESGTGR